MDQLWPRASSRGETAAIFTDTPTSLIRTPNTSGAQSIAPLIDAVFAVSRARKPFQPLSNTSLESREICKTICVVGAPHGGGALVAGLVRRLGVFMGTDVDSESNEDRAFLGHHGRRGVFHDPRLVVARSDFLQGAKAVVAGRNRVHNVWGWSDALSMLYLPAILSSLRNPVFILVTRDPGTIGYRDGRPNTLADCVTLPHIIEAVDLYGECARFISGLDRPVLVVSYERALQDPRHMEIAVAEFLGVKPDLRNEASISQEVCPVCHSPLEEEIGVADAGTGLSRYSVSLQAYLVEAVRLRHENKHTPSTIDRASTPSVADMHLHQSLVAITQNDLESARQHASAAVIAYGTPYPELLDGPIGVIACESVGAGDRIYPDTVCGAFYILGMCALLVGRAADAIMYLNSAEKIMRLRLERLEELSPLCSGNYAATLFHLGISARVLGKSLLACSIARAFKRYWEQPYFAGLGTLNDFDVFSARYAELEDQV